MNREFVLQIVFMIMALYTLIYYYDSLFGRYKKCFYIVSIILYAVIQIFMNSFDDIHPYLNLIINIVIVLSVGLFAFRGNRLKIILCGMLYCVLWLMSEVMLMFFLMILKIQYTDFVLMGSFITKLLLLILVMLIRVYFSKEAFPDMPKKYNVIVLLFPISSILIIACIFYIADRNYNGQMALISTIACSVVLLSNFFVIKLYNKIVEELVLRNLNMLFSKQLQLCEQQIIEREETMLSIRTMRHDMKNHLLLIRETLENQNIQKAEEYIDALIVNTIVKKEIAVNTGNVVIDSLVNFKYALAQREGIRFIVNIVVPYDLPCDDADICVILGNLLDNAIEACLQVEKDHRFIEINITAKRNHLAIVLKNSYAHKIKKGMEGNIVTTKQNRQEHGYGLISVERAVDKYNGTMNLEFTDTEFTVTIILFITYD